jgi:hypothetical protein
MAADEPQSFEVPLVWVGFDETPVLTANQFLGQVHSDEFFISFGQATPPPISALTDDERRAQAEAIRAVPVRTLSRLGMTRERVEDLIRILNETLEIHNQQRKAVKR